MHHAKYVNKCSTVIRRLLLREASLRDELISAVEDAFESFPTDEVPFGDNEKCENVMDLLTNHHAKPASEVLSAMDDSQIRDVVDKIYNLNIDLILDEAMQKVDDLWKTTYLRPMKFHN